MPIPESEGVFTNEEIIDRICPQEGEERRIKKQIWESNDGAFEDEKYSCLTCGHVWWVDGIDS